MLKFIACDIYNNEIKIDNIESFELSKNAGAACDGLRLNFIRDKSLNEITEIYVFDEEKLIFNGYCDTQRETVSKDGFEIFIYARSSACILTDNEAKPFTYNSPSARSLFVSNAEEFGFSCNLPELFCNSQYSVSKGTSCFGAINDFVLGITGREIIVDADNCLTLPLSKKEICLNNYNVISEKRIINRGAPISRIDYKISSKDKYVYHIKSRMFEKMGINRSRMINISSLPNWQRDFVSLNTLKSAGASYYSFEFEIEGCFDFSLYDKIAYKSSIFSELKDYYISSVCCRSDKNGESTKLMVYKNIDLEEITYVAE